MPDIPQPVATVGQSRVYALDLTQANPYDFDDFVRHISRDVSANGECRVLMSPAARAHIRRQFACAPFGVDVRIIRFRWGTVHLHDHPAMPDDVVLVTEA